MLEETVRDLQFPVALVYDNFMKNTCFFFCYDIIKYTYI